VGVCNEIVFLAVKYAHRKQGDGKQGGAQDPAIVN
jgi:hypothetical protein